MRVGRRDAGAVRLAAVSLGVLVALAGCTGGAEQPGPSGAGQGSPVVRFTAGEELAQGYSSLAGTRFDGTAGDHEFAVTVPAQASDVQVISVRELVSMADYPLPQPASFGLLFQPTVPPGAGEYLAATVEVRISGPDLAGADPSRLAVWRFDATGGQFHLLPFTMVDGAISVRVFHLGAIGYGPATPEQLAAVAAPAGALERAQQEMARDPRLRSPSVPAEASQQWGRSLAQAADAELDASAADPHQRLEAASTALAVERQRQLAGDSHDFAPTAAKISTVLGQVEQALLERCAASPSPAAERPVLVRQLLLLVRLRGLLDHSGNLTNLTGDSIPIAPTGDVHRCVGDDAGNIAN